MDFIMVAIVGCKCFHHFCVHAFTLCLSLDLQLQMKYWMRVGLSSTML